MKLYDLFYDRRKGHYRNLRKPISQIVSIHDLARAVIAIVLQEPDNARARPQSLLNREEAYNRIFDNHFNRDVFVTCILIDRQVNDYLKGRDDLSRDERRDIRFYVDMVIASDLTRSSKPTPQQLAVLAQTVVSPIPDNTLKGISQAVLEQYQRLGGTDKVAKGTDLRREIVSNLEELYASPELGDKTLED